MAVKRTKTPRRSEPTAKAKTPKRPAKSAARKPGTKTARKPAVSPVPKAKAAPGALIDIIESALDDMKAVNVKVLDVRKLTDVADTLIIASGNSDRHVRSIADRVLQFAKREGFRPTGVEGERDGEWVLVDLRDVIVHIMLPRIREFYRLENLWDVSAVRREVASGKSGT